SRSSKLQRAGERAAGALLVAAILGILEIVIRVSEISPLILAPPSEIARALWNGIAQGIFWPHLVVTLTEMLGGFAIGTVLGVIGGVLITEFSRVGRLIYPYLIAIQSVPKVAMAPLLIIWLGYGISSKIVLVTLI